MSWDPLKKTFLFWGAGEEFASGVLFLEVSLALVGVASPAYSDYRIWFFEMQ
jgi:hypothetical protein